MLSHLLSKYLNNDVFDISSEFVDAYLPRVSSCYVEVSDSN